MTQPGSSLTVRDAAARLPGPLPGFWSWGRGLTANLVFALYAVTVEGWLVRSASEVVHGQRTHYLLGSLLAALLVAEPVLIRARLEQIGRRLCAAGALNAGERAEIPGGVLLAFAHMAFGVVLAFVAFHAFGGTLSEEPSGAAIAVMFAATVRELYIFLLFVAGIGSGLDTRRRHQSQLPAWATDLGLIAFACVSYSATWRVIVGNAEPLNQQNLGLTLTYTAAATLLFLFFFLPARAAYVVEEATFATTLGRQARLWLSIAVASLSALSPLFVFEDGRSVLTPARAKELARAHDDASTGRPALAAPTFASLVAARPRPDALEIEGFRGLAVPDDLGGLTDLERLALRNLGLKQLPSGVLRQRSLKQLALAGNELSELPDAINDLSELESLELSGNPLRGLPLRQGGLPKLTGLFLAHARFGPLPASLGELPLQYLLVTYCDLRELPEGLGRHGTLGRLDIRGNQIAHLPASLAKSPLDSIDWSANDLRELPPDLLQLRSLKYVALASNRLERVPDGVAAALPDLKRLDLRKNPLAQGEAERLRASLPGVEILTDP